MKGNSIGHASARGFCIPIPWHSLMLNLFLLWGNGDRWQIWPSCLEPGTSMAEATTRCTLSHDFGQEVCLSLLGWWNTAYVTKFGEHASFLHFEVSLWNTCSLCLLFLLSVKLNLTCKKPVRDISYFDILIPWARTQEFLWANSSSKNFVDRNLASTNPKIVNFIFSCSTEELIFSQPRVLLLSMQAHSLAWRLKLPDCSFAHQAAYDRARFQPYQTEVVEQILF